MSPREHARLASELIEASGSLDEASKACRVRKSVLSGYQQPHSPFTMPADVIADLEDYCGKPIYSRALFERFDAPEAAGCLQESAQILNEDTCDLSRRVRIAFGDGKLSPRELDGMATEATELEAAVERVLALIRAKEAEFVKEPAPKAD